MAKKENNYYFAAFAKCMAYAGDALAILRGCFENYDLNNVEAHLQEMHTVEHAADMSKHEMMERLMKEFLPPIEREDIVELSHIIDDVTDSIEDVLVGAYMYNISALRPEVGQFVELISKCCAALNALMEEFPNFRKSATLKEKLILINDIEEEGDRLFLAAMHRLYTEEKDPVAVVTWTKMFDRLEACCDCCEEVADMVEQVLMKNS